MQAISHWDIVLWGCLCALSIESLTLVLRFGLGLEARRCTPAPLRRLTFGIRVHHSYAGALLLPWAFALPHLPAWLATAFAVAGIGMLLSDIAHHFLVLWPLTGRPEFDLWYPGFGRRRDEDQAG